MKELDCEAIEERVYFFWRTREYERAVTFLLETLNTYHGEDVAVLEVGYSLLNSSLSTLGRYREAENALRDGLARLPASFFLHRGLAQFMWDIVKQPRQALSTIDDYLSTHLELAVGDSEKELSARIQALSLRGRLLVALGRIGEGLQTLKTILPLLPEFIPVLGHLFDYDLVADLLTAGVRDPALQDFINRITEPRFLVNGITEKQFEQTKHYLNSAEYLRLEE